MFTLDNMKKISDYYAYPFNQIKMIHVGGTNGKGSTSTMIYHVLKEKFKVGLYTSPYELKRFDNIKINEQIISDLEIKAYFERYEKAFHQFQLSEFEIDTWISLMWFYDQKVDYAVIEVGLGGKDDATNVITPILSLITNVGYDHVDVLGHDIKDIAFAKAGIIKHKVPIMIGYDFDHEGKDIIKHVANQHHANLMVAKKLNIQSKSPLIFEHSHLDFHLNHLPYYQHHNLSLALTALIYLKEQNHDITSDMMLKGLSKFSMSKRFQILRNKPLLIIDGAHNLEGIQALIESLKMMNQKEEPTVICAFLKDKPYDLMLEELKDLSKDVHLFSFQHERALNIDDVKNLNIIKHDSLDEMQVLINKPFVIITGSLYFLRAIDPFLKEIHT